MAIVTILSLYLVAWPVPFDPAAWTPPTPPAREGVYAPNSRLAPVERLIEGMGIGPEDVAFDAQGRVYSGYVDGRIVRCNPDGTDVSIIANTGGRPLGMDFDAAGNLIVADAVRGLLSIAPNATVAVLSVEADGIPFKFADDVKVAKSGLIYFSDASDKFGKDAYLEDLMEHRGNGRLLVYDPKDRMTTCLTRDLHFANGVALDPDETFVLVNETGKYRILRHWLTGDKKGTTEVFLDNLPGIPDNLSCNGRDRFWVALFSPRSTSLDGLLPKPFLRKLVYRLPNFLRPAPAHHGMVLGVSFDGHVLELLEDSAETSFAPITSVEERDGMVYLGSLHANAIGRLALSQPAGGFEIK